MKVSKKVKQDFGLYVGDILKLSYQLRTREKNPKTGFGLRYKDLDFKTFLIKSVSDTECELLDLETNENITIALSYPDVSVVANYFNEEITKLAKQFRFDRTWRYQEFHQVRNFCTIKIATYRKFLIREVADTALVFDKDYKVVITLADVEKIQLSDLRLKTKYQSYIG